MGNLPTTKKETNSKEKSSEEEFIHIYWMRITNDASWWRWSTTPSSVQEIEVKFKVNNNGNFIFPKLKLYLFDKRKHLVGTIDHTYLDNMTYEGDDTNNFLRTGYEPRLQQGGGSQIYPYSKTYLIPINLSTIKFKGRTKNIIVFVIPTESASYKPFSHAIFVIGDTKKVYVKSLKNGSNPLDFDFPERSLLLREEGRYAPQSSEQPR